MENKILVVDIETTGLDKVKDCIVEIGAAEIDLKTGIITGVFNSLCREKHLTAKHRDAWIFSNSDLTPEEVRNAPPFEEVVAKFQELASRYTRGATAFNRVFDMGFLHVRGVKFPRLVPCPMLLSTDICEIPGKFGKNKWPKVEEAFSFFYPGFEYTEKHRGADDAYHEAMIVRELHKIGFYEK